MYYKFPVTCVETQLNVNSQYIIYISFRDDLYLLSANFVTPVLCVYSCLCTVYGFCKLSDYLIFPLRLQK